MHSTRGQNKTYSLKTVANYLGTYIINNLIKVRFLFHYAQSKFG